MRIKVSRADHVRIWRVAAAHGGMAFVLATVGVVVLAATAHATRCPTETEQIRLEQEQRDGLSLPDCRAYEQVSPTNKNLADASGRAGLVQSARTGEAVTFFSILPLPGTPGSSSFPIYLSTRGEEGWSRPQGLLLPTTPGPIGGSVLGWSEELKGVLTEAPGEAGEIDVSENYGKEYFTLGSGGIGRGAPYVADATLNGSTVILEDEAPLVPGAIEGKPNVYEWHENRLSLIAADAAAGPAAGARGTSYTENAISEDGSRVFFTDMENGLVYVDEPQVGRKIPVSKGSATWEAATPDGSNVFYVEGGELYRFDVDTETAEPLASEVIGTLGVSADGSYVYFAKSPTNVYVWHDGEVALVATVSGFSDSSDWYGACVCGGGGDSTGAKSSRVTPDGHTLLFSSIERLTSYENAGHFELYLYHAATGTITCISCNPLADKATSNAYLTHNNLPDSPTIRMTVLTRNLSASGQRVFFQTEEGLVPGDINGQMDVYEWEQEGAGSCPVGSSGCIYLLSTGQSTSESYFGDASMEGDDAFFFTRQSLVAQDQDYNDDLYDARVNGGITAQNQPSQTPCTSEETCAGPAAAAPAFTTPTSAVFSGAGNLAPVVVASPAKPKREVKKKSAKHRKKKKIKKPRRAKRSNTRSKGRTA